MINTHYGTKDDTVKDVRRKSRQCNLEFYTLDKHTQKSKAYTPLPLFHGTFNTHTTVNKNIHAQKRRIVNQRLSEAALQTSERFILENVRRLCAALYAVARRGGKSVLGGWSENFLGPSGVCCSHCFIR